MPKPQLPPNLDLCVKCKTSKNLCGISPCPLLQRWYKDFKLMTPKISKIDASYAPPSFFVGRYDYPHLNAGPMLTIEKMPSEILDNSDSWNDLTQEQILQYRLSMYRTKTELNAKRPLDSPIIEKSHELLLGINPVEVEVELEKEIIPHITLDTRLAPHGPVAPIKKLSINENQTPLRPIEKVYYDTDLRATEALKLLGKEKVPVSYMTRVFSAGMVGREKNRKLVPTRWSITAIDDILSKQNIERIKNFQVLGEYRLFSSYFFGNKFLIILIPKVWGFEAVEVWLKGAYLNPSDHDVGVNDYELYKGRKTYASNVSGGYYATRLAVTEYLLKIRRQAQVISLREIDDNYKMPLGVWVVRQAARQAMENEYKTADTLDNAFKMVDKILRYPSDYYKHKSKLYLMHKEQRSLDAFFGNKRSK